MATHHFFATVKKSATTVCPPRPKLCRLPTQSHQSHRQHYNFVGILCHLCNIALSYCTLYNVQSRDHIISFYVTLATIVIQKEMLEDSLRQDKVVGLLEFDNQSILHTTSNPLFSILRIFHFLLTSIHQTLGTGIGTLDLVT